MAEQVSVDRLESHYPDAGFETGLGRIAPFYGREVNYVLIDGKWLTPPEARHAAAALLTVADRLDNTATIPDRQTEDR